REERLFSAGKDGALRVWQTSPFSLVRKIQVTDLPLLKIAVNPRVREVAVVQSDGISVHTLKVLNYETGKEKFSQNLPEVPLVLEYSPQGNFIVASKTDWKSLTFYSADTGRTLSYLRDGFGIVSFLMVSGSENTLLTYTPTSGMFTYWELKKGKQKELVRTAVDLKNLCAYNQRFALASRADNLVAVDMVSGAVTAAAKAPGITKIAASPDGRIISLAAVGGKMQLQRWLFIAPVGMSPGVLSRSGDPVSLPLDTADALLTADSGYFALADGAIGCMHGGSSQLDREGLNSLSPITDILAAEGVVYALTAEKVYAFRSDLFTANPADVLAPASFTASVKDNPVKAPVGVIQSSDGNVFLYTRAPDSPGKIVRFDMRQCKVLAQFTGFSLPLLAVEEAGGYLFALEKNGSLKKIDSSSLRSVYDYPAWNVQSFAPLDGKTFWAGKNRSGEMDSPLIMINTETGETVPVTTHTSLLLVYKILYDAPRGKVYFLGLYGAAGGKTETRIFLVGNPQKPENHNSFAAYPAADVGAVAHIDPRETAVYTTLGSTVIRKWAGSRWVNFQSNNSLVTAMRDYGKLLFGINADGSVSAWEKQTGRLVGTFCILKDGRWMAVSSSGAALTSRATGSP
ncbi:MAG: hypothetical protein FWG35_08140, partial [Spirochaetaceae bacterium]|nr:hypothetical protein [Spirochaetaceae bacterium]